jgi:hypothetical protein
LIQFHGILSSFRENKIDIFFGNLLGTSGEHSKAVVSELDRAVE